MHAEASWTSFSEMFILKLCCRFSWYLIHESFLASSTWCTFKWDDFEWLPKWVHAYFAVLRMSAPWSLGTGCIAGANSWQSWELTGAHTHSRALWEAALPSTFAPISHRIRNSRLCVLLGHSRGRIIGFCDRWKGPDIPICTGVSAHRNLRKPAVTIGNKMERDQNPHFSGVGVKRPAKAPIKLTAKNYFPAPGYSRCFPFYLVML